MSPATIQKESEAEILKRIDELFMERVHRANKQYHLPFNFTYKGFFVAGEFQGHWTKRTYKIQEAL